MIEHAYNTRISYEAVLSSQNLIKISMVSCVKEWFGDVFIAEMVDILEDNMIVPFNLIEVWIGHWILTLWDTLPNLHAEHRKLKGASGCGPAAGMRSFYPKPVAQPTFKGVVISTIPACHSIESAIATTLAAINNGIADPEIEDLYN